MNCPFCKEKITEISRLCANCGKPLLDFNYFENMNKMKEKYGKSSLHDLSHEKLTFEEIITIQTFIERRDHHCGDMETSEQCREDGTFSNLGKRLNEMKNSEEYI